MGAVLRRVAAFAVLFVAACSSDGDPHEQVDCDSTWQANGYTECESACASSARALGASGPACQARTVENRDLSCQQTFEFAGAVGCCTATTPRVLFGECE
jgi:hypothetical protein